VDSARARGQSGAMIPLPPPMRQALDAARAAAKAGEVPVGAVIVHRGAIIATAANAPRDLHDPTAHAEIQVIRRAAAALERERLEDCDLWVTLEPCAMCAGAIAHARIARVYYAAADPKGGAVEHGARVFAQPTCHHRPEIYSGIGEREAAALLREFFTARR
jgi:tRNA(adenine34) deaminase